MIAAVLDHLWQSSLVALGAWLLVLALRKAAAAVRHGLWFAASLKFLVPFAALAALGRHLAPSVRLSVGTTQTAFIKTATQPFSHAVLARFPFAPASALQAPLMPAQAAPHLDLAPILLGVWALGCAAVLIAWAVRWARVRKVVRAARPLAWPAPMPVLASPSLMEPGLIGLLRPVLVVPQSLPERLARSEVDAILAHEISHLRRRDNLTAAAHMLVEALFWFHPLVWWIGARLITERERACDEAVVEAGHDRAAYARSLLESARLYLQSPLSCVAGAAGFDLKARVEAIMSAPPASPLSRANKALLFAAGACAFAAPVAAGLLTTPDAKTAIERAVTLAASAAPGRIFARPPGRPGDPTPAAAPAPDEREPVRRVALAPHRPVLASADAIARLDPAPAPLVQDIAAPVIQSASAARTAVEAPARAEARKQAADFVRSYAQSALDPMGRIARWGDPLCIKVAGLAPDQDALVRARVEEVAKAIGASVLGPGCRVINLEIAFTSDPKGVLDREGGRRGWSQDGQGVTVELLGRRNAKPVQALYRDVVADQRGAQVPGVSTAFDDCNSRIACPLRVMFQVVLVVVDLGRVRDRSPAVVADYVAMLALSQPRSLDRCHALPSVTDLFAACPGRRAPAGLTSADAAYLTALYATDPEAKLVSQQSDIADRMAGMLTAAQVAAADRAAPG